MIKYEVESAEEIIQVAARQPESGRTKRRHQSRSDRHAGNHIPLALGRTGHNPGQTAEESDQHVIDGWLRTGQQLALRLADRRDQEKKRRSDDTEYRRRCEIAEGAFDQIEIGDPQSQAEPHDGTHQRGDQHRTDNHRRRVRIQTQRSYEGCKDQNPEVRPLKLYAFLDRLDRFEFIFLFLADIEITDKEVPNLLVQQSFFHPIKINVCIRTSR